MASLGAALTGSTANSPQSDQVTSKFNADQAGGTAAYGQNLAEGQIPQIQQTQQGQSALAQLLMQQATGQGPNVSNAQLQQGLNQVQQQQAGAIGSVKGINPALQARMIQQSGQTAAMTAADQASVNRQQQQVNAQNSLGQTLASQQAGNLGAFGAGANLYGTAAGLNQATQAQNASNLLGLRGQNTQLQESTNNNLTSLVPGASSNAGSGLSALATRMAMGGVVPGVPRFPGNDPRNDTVVGDMPDGGHVMVAKGEGVLPNSVMDDEEKAAAFAKAMVKKKRKSGFGAVLEARETR